MTNRRILRPNPAAYRGIRFEQLEHSVREELGQYISPCGGMEPSLPFFRVELGGVERPAIVAMHKACHDGAASAKSQRRALPLQRTPKSPIATTTKPT
jgi:hypothetical protein